MKIRRLLLGVGLLIGYAMSMISQSAMIDIPQTIILQGGVLHLNVVSYEPKDQIYHIMIIDHQGHIVDQRVIQPTQGVQHYQIQLSNSLLNSCRIDIRNGDQLASADLYILPRPTELLTDMMLVNHEDGIGTMQNQEICNTNGLGLTPIYVSISDTNFGGAILTIDKVAQWINYPINIVSKSLDQLMILDQRDFSVLNINADNGLTYLKLSSNDVGSQVVALDQLTNGKMKLFPRVEMKDSDSHKYDNLSMAEIQSLANQLLIAEIQAGANTLEKGGTDQISDTDDHWDVLLSKPSIDVDPTEYVDFNSIKNFIDEVVKNLRIYGSDAQGYQSYVYPLQTKPSIRQPLYLMNGRVSSLDSLLSLDQNQITNIRVYTDMRTLVKTFGPTASAGLVMATSTLDVEEKHTFNIGALIHPSHEDVDVSDLAVSPFAGATNQPCYMHNARLGQFNMKVIYHDEEILELENTTLLIQPKSTSK